MFSIIFFNLFVLIGCHNKNNQILTIKNNSDQNLLYVSSFLYPDTTLKCCPPERGTDEYYRWLIKANSKLVNENCYKDFFITYDTMDIFLFNVDTLYTVPWDTINKNYMILIRYDLSLEDLERLNWTVTYPPTKDMDVKMYQKK